MSWQTARQIAAPSQGSIPTALAPILERLGIRAENWLESVHWFDRRFGQIVGSVARLREAASRTGRHWFRGATACAAVFT